MENTKEPTLEEYGLNIFLYKAYKKKMEELFLIKNSQEFSFWKFIFIIPVPLCLIAFFALKTIWLLPLIFLFSFTLYGYVEDYFNKNNTKLQNTIKEIESYRERHSVKAFEEKSSAYFSKQVDDFYKDRVHRKRWDGNREEETYIEMLSEVSKIWQIFYGHKYPNAYYLLKKSEDRRFFVRDHKINRFNFSNLYGIKTKEEIKPPVVIGKNELISEKLITDKSIKRQELLQKKNFWTYLTENNKTAINEANNPSIKDEFNSTKTKEVLDVINITPPEKLFRTARKIDNWEEINKKRKETGDKGEEVVVLLEQDYLISINRKDLADKVYHSSKERGDGLGYDILSYFDDGREKFIEVKSTNNSINSAFNISKNELEFLKENLENAFLYRVSFQKAVPEVEVKTSPEILKSEITATQFIVKL